LELLSRHLERSFTKKEEGVIPVRAESNCERSFKREKEEEEEEIQVRPESCRERSFRKEEKDEEEVIPMSAVRPRASRKQTEEEAIPV
jgi:hypothetical protein